MSDDTLRQVAQILKEEQASARGGTRLSPNKEGKNQYGVEKCYSFVADRIEVIEDGIVLAVKYGDILVSFFPTLDGKGVVVSVAKVVKGKYSDVGEVEVR